MDGKLQTALNSGDAPDIFMARGGGKLAAVVEAGQVQDLTDALSDDTKTALGEASLAALSVDDKVYGVPSSVLPGGIYYSKDLFAQAGITETPTTFDELERRRRQAQGRRHRPDRPRRQGRLARRPLVLLLRAARVHRRTS